MGPRIRGLSSRSQGQTGRAVAGRDNGGVVVVWTSDSQRVGVVDGCRHRRLLDSSCRMSRSPQRIRARCYTLVVHGVNRLRLPAAARCEFHLFHQKRDVGGFDRLFSDLSYAPSRMSLEQSTCETFLPAKELLSSRRGRRFRITFTDPYATV
jgi:hypothetical protein